MKLFLSENPSMEKDRHIDKDGDPLVRVTGMSAVRNNSLLLQDISFEISKGHLVGLIGKNGVGKTTLIEAFIEGAHRHIYQGNIEIAGKAFPAKSIRESAKLVAYVPQRPNIPKQMLVTDYILLGRTAYQSYLAHGSSQDLAIVTEVMEQLNLSQFAMNVMGELSGGELQRVVIARALAQKTPFLILDEPTTSLDIYYQLAVLDLLRRLCLVQDVTVLCSLHDINLASKYCDRLVMLGQNSILAYGRPSAVLTKENIKRAFSVDVDLHFVNGELMVMPQLGEEGLSLPDSDLGRL